MSQLNKIRLYQFGDFVIPPQDRNEIWDTQVKSTLDNSPFTNGKIKTDKFNIAYLDDTTIQLVFSLESGKNRHQIEKLFYGKPQKVFLFEEYKSKVFVGPNSVNNLNQLDYRIFYTYGQIVKHANWAYYGCENGFDKYNITIRLMNNKYLIEDTRLCFIKYSEELKLKTVKWGDGTGTLWGSGTGKKWGATYYDSSLIMFNQITQKQRQDLFECCDDKNGGFFIHKDLFFAQEIPKIDINSTNYLEYNLSGSQGQILPFIQATTGLNLVSTLINNVIIFEISKDGVVASLANGEYIQFINNKTQHGFKISCLNASSPPLLSIFTHKAVPLYNTINNEIINIYNPKSRYYLGYKIEQIGTGIGLFNFSNYLPFYENQDFLKDDTIIITRNFTGNLKIKIQNLAKYV